MTIKKNILLKGQHNKPILTDIFYVESNKPKSVVIFCHGYKGFKDWGAWNLMAKAFAESGFFFVKFNFSHNGGTVEQPIDFPDLDAFGNNNYTKELDDLKSVIDWIYEDNSYSEEADVNHITLIGHSRGGGIVTIKAEEDKRITKVISLAGVCDYAKRTATIGNLEEWRKDGVKYILNGRTKQKMPHFFQFYEDFIENEKRLTIQRAVAHLKIPYLIIHGNKDKSVLMDEAHNLHSWKPDSNLEIVDEADHVFNTKHPWDDIKMSVELRKAANLCVSFIKKP